MKGIFWILVTLLYKKGTHCETLNRSLPIQVLVIELEYQK